MRKYKILFVDDDEQVLNGIRRNLHKASQEWELFYETNGEDALKCSYTTTLDLIITDARMPHMTGGDLIVALKQNVTTQDIPIMMLTGYADEVIKKQALENGVIEFLYKPILPEELIMRIQNILKLKKLNDDLRELNEQKNHFLGIAAHDLRNPLQSIISIIGLYQLKYKDKLDDGQKHKMEAVLKEVRYMKELINDFLDISSIEAGKLILNKQKTTLCNILSSQLDFYIELANNKNIKLEHYCNGGEDTVISVDSGKIVQVVNNLITNAIKFSHEEGLIIISASTTKDQDFVMISIQDFGQGIPLNEQEKLFKPFGRTSITATGGEKSTGLGLAIVKKIIEAHGGKIELHSEFGKGSTFTIYLPVEN